MENSSIIENSIQLLFAAQQKHQDRLRLSSAQDRINKLRFLKKIIQANEKKVFEALKADLNKNMFEASITEVYLIYAEIDYAIKNLKSWMKRRRKPFTITTFLSDNWLYYEPIGNALIISPWNYPFQLTMSPLVSAVAAGCTAIIKPSEYSPHTSLVITLLVREAFPPQEITCLCGDSQLAEVLLKLPFNKIFFTGSPQVGKIIMKAAAENLADMTLELGGKSPVIIDHKCNIKLAAEKIAWGKLINAGQTCIAPDYVIIPPDLIEPFINAFNKACTNMFFNEDGEMDKDRYAKIINPKHFSRLEELLAASLKNNGQKLWEAKCADPNSFPPTILSGLGENSRIMNEEIFGPILPLLPYENMEDIVLMINSKPKPLAMYIFSDDSSFSNQIIKRCSSGSVCVNDVLIQVSNPNLPFGGINNSGTGSCHGHFGFKAFSHERAVMKQTKFSMSKLIYPPYNGKGKVFSIIKKWM